MLLNISSLSLYLEVQIMLHYDQDTHVPALRRNYRRDLNGGQMHVDGCLSEGTDMGIYSCR